MVDNEHLFYDKELSWLSFNERVLQEAMDKSVPIIERFPLHGVAQLWEICGAECPRPDEHPFEDRDAR